MQRAVEDPGVGCGGWWSVGEGMKGKLGRSTSPNSHTDQYSGLKRPRKRRPAQSRRPEHELDPAPIIKTPTPSPFAIRRRHSTTFEDALSSDTHSRYVSPLSSSSLPPRAVDAYAQRVSKERGGELLPSMDDLSLLLPPLHIPNATHLLPTPPSSSRTVVFGTYGYGGEIGGEMKREFSQGGHSFNSNYEEPRATHTPTASSSSSYSTQSFGSASSSNRPNPMSISSLLNERDSAVATVVTERLDKMDIDMDVDIEEPTRRSHHPPSPAPPTLSSRAQAEAAALASAQIRPKREPEPERDVEMLPEFSGRPAHSHSNRKTAKVETPFSSDQTLRPPSPCSTSPRSNGRRSTTPVAAALTPKPSPPTSGPSSSNRTHSPNPTSNSISTSAPVNGLGTSPTAAERRHAPAPSTAERPHRDRGDRHRDREREREGGLPHGEVRPSSRSRAHAERTTPAKPSRPPPPVPDSSYSATKGSTSTRERERERKSTESGAGRSGKNATAKSFGASKPWASSMDLSVMEPKSESD